jgi:hypothetical protein
MIVDMSAHFAAAQAESKELFERLQRYDLRAVEITRTVRKLQRQDHPLEEIAYDLRLWGDMYMEDLEKTPAPANASAAAARAARAQMPPKNSRYLLATFTTAGRRLALIQRSRAAENRTFVVGESS